MSERENVEREKPEKGFVTFVGGHLAGKTAEVEFGTAEITVVKEATIVSHCPENGPQFNAIDCENMVVASWGEVMIAYPKEWLLSQAIEQLALSYQNVKSRRAAEG